MTNIALTLHFVLEQQQIVYYTKIFENKMIYMSKLFTSVSVKLSLRFFMTFHSAAEFNHSLLLSYLTVEYVMLNSEKKMSEPNLVHTRCWIL